ncbi:hypothetical protein PUNSTDRAFT_146953 [Punctularia strigosozonata HHB-11173 SS5]|uniref:Uncharacterized protein n=1 Tax=Punctularia strigosozonata (strain HHB-11173) TaxID=741275 RepID=R7RZT3_PUNST|nr:uncharacterized protein PUNSTDRAFT_146953 [Punctularia strigosozonata HHB-11173 SS5]EIN03625.1 hypothetical protein PUNSTDRAFT_146953 [Punctularia strigosozonata HHB-11173 SS5]
MSSLSASAASLSSSLSTLARSKLQSVSSSGSKDSCSLHRWVLLKNSIVRSHPAVADKERCSATCTYAPEQDGHQEEHEHEEDEVEDSLGESFMFPDVDALLASDKRGSEDEWLDSLLENLNDDDAENDAEIDVQVAVLAVDEDEDDDTAEFTPFASPSSSSDDLLGPPSAPVAIPYQYPVPYPPLPATSFNYFSSDVDASISPPYADALPFTYAPADDHADLPMPDAIEDTSDDESDAPLTPWGRSTSSLSALVVDPASVPLPAERQPLVSVYVDVDDAFFNPFELDPLPFAADEPRTFERERAYYPECS